MEGVWRGFANSSCVNLILGLYYTRSIRRLVKSHPFTPPFVALAWLVALGNAVNFNSISGTLSLFLGLAVVQI